MEAEEFQQEMLQQKLNVINITTEGMCIICYASFESLKIQVYWDVTTCQLVNSY